MKIIYDFGAHKGDNIPYYLLKGDKVIAVEGNPGLCDEIKRRFAQEILEGIVFVECCALTVGHTGDVEFYLHNENLLKSQFPTPKTNEINNFTKILIQSKNVVEIIGMHGPPYYVKIDIEHYDDIILRNLFQNGIFPPYISAEAHTIKPLITLLEYGGYNAFKVVDGNTVQDIYKNKCILSSGLDVSYSFPKHSAGPFGDDIDGNWMTPENLIKHLATLGFGWIDIHATNLVSAKSEGLNFPTRFLNQLTLKHILRYSAKRLIRKFIKIGSVFP